MKINKYLKHQTTIKTHKLFSGINKSEETVKIENRYLSTVGKGELKDSSWCIASSLFVDFHENKWECIQKPYCIPVKTPLLNEGTVVI